MAQQRVSFRGDDSCPSDNAGGVAESFDPMEALAAVSAKRQGRCSGVNPPLEASTTFSYVEPSDMDKYLSHELGPEQETFMYSREYNPTVFLLAQQLAALEGTEAAYCTSSGMAAISSVLMELVSAGDHVVASNRLYGGTLAFFTEILPRFQVQVSFVDITKPEEVDESFLAGRTKVLYFESMSNPSLTVPDIPVLAEIAHKHRVKAVVDNTFAPLVISPARLGVDIVIHSLTKFINGASDILGGAICGPADFLSKLNDFHSGTLTLLGGTMQPQTAWQISMRLPHLGIRMREHAARAGLFARRLHSLGVNTMYPGLPSHPDHELCSRIRNPLYGFGGMLTIDAGSLDAAQRFARSCQNETGFGHYAVSLGYHDTLLSISSSSTAHNLTEEERAAAGVALGLIRVSVGFTGTAEQRWMQLFRALVAAGMVAEGATWEE